MRQILIFAGVVLTLTACLKDKSVEPVIAGPCADTIYFNDDLLIPIFNTSCNTSGCHSSGDAAAGYVLEGFDNISDNSDVLLKVLQHEASVTPMPLGGDKLADSLIQKFDCWIQQGKLNN